MQNRLSIVHDRCHLDLDNEIIKFKGYFCTLTGDVQEMSVRYSDRTVDVCRIFAYSIS